MNLSEYQRKFTLMVANLIIFAYKEGFELTFGDAYRTIDQAAANAAAAVGIKNSLHCKRLAVDLMLFKNGVFQTNAEAYLPLVLEWERMGGSAGYRFKRKDAVHFSLSPDGGKTR